MLLSLIVIDSFCCLLVDSWVDLLSSTPSTFGACITTMGADKTAIVMGWGGTNVSVSLFQYSTLNAQPQEAQNNP